MNDKVKELVERTKLTPEELKDKLPPNDGYGYYQAFGEAVAQAQQDKIFKDPDLALIDRGEAQWGNVFLHRVIPLAEALKESK